MDEKLKQLLSSIDSVDDYESPDYFNYTLELEKVKKLKIILDQLLGLTLEIDNYVQDASFFTTLSFVHDNLCDIAIRFSNYGNLTSIYIYKLEAKLPIKVLIQTLEDNGYVYVSCDALEVPYDGIDKNVFDGGTWWDRYFNYV